MSKRIWVHIGGWALVVLLMLLNQWHRAAPNQPAHLHTQLVSIATFALLVVLSVWGGMMLNQAFENRPPRNAEGNRA